MSAHAVDRQEIPASREATFDLLRGDGRRPTWDAMVRRAPAPAVPGVGR